MGGASSKPNSPDGGVRFGDARRLVGGGVAGGDGSDDSSASSRPSSPRRDGSELDAASDRPSSNVPFRGFVGDAVRSESTSTDAGVGAQRGGRSSFTRTLEVAAMRRTAKSQFATAPTLQVLARFRDRSSLKTS